MKKLSKSLYRIAENISTAEGISPGPHEALKLVFENERLTQHLIQLKRDLLQKKITARQYYESLGLILKKVLERYSVDDVLTYLKSLEKSTFKDLGINHEFLKFFEEGA